MSILSAFEELCDEPFTQVDPVNIDEVKALIRERSKDHGIIVTDHNYDAISSVADNLFVISDGYTSPVRSRIIHNLSLAHG